jgi:hypothetical protein
MSKVDSQPLPNVLKKVVELLVENRIKIEAMEQILIKTNAVADALYTDAMKDMQRQKKTEVTRLLAQAHKSDPPKR